MRWLGDADDRDHPFTVAVEALLVLLVVGAIVVGAAFVFGTAILHQYGESVDCVTTVTLEGHICS